MLSTWIQLTWKVQVSDMVKNLSRAIIIILIAVLSTTLFQTLAINNVSPNLMIITIVSISVLLGREEGLIFAFFFGLIQDIFYFQVVGFHVIIYCLIAYFTGYLYRNFYAESVVIPLVAIGVSDLSYNIIVFITTYLFRGSINLLYYSYAIILPEVTYTVVIAVVLYRLYIIYSQWITEYEKDKRKGDDELYERRP